ncbi:nitrite reductase small subunit NirD [Streptomyces tsukubensis]|uniref:Nitrite reductase (NAD(P)H) small subunit n=1 Tax=Streptomyces tsukubensis TaxID=83656 RepID=A0A1V4AG86_9ACTN|nr:nitrite reductase small subunit NirD [Streptomyces tsukubensis]OON82688.1 nitrite reductase (NAD(P)H) small subunit [Streptomyces tsukubensis]QFR92141.1 nitrite reductase small subunit NirD [Streptomyces tsukubensis]
MTATGLATTPRTAVCLLDALPVEEGRGALLPDGTPVALFRLRDGSVHALGNHDPYTGAPVMCHGIVGDRDGRRTVASPLGKQVFDLLTGVCLDDDRAALPVHTVRVEDGVIQVSWDGNTHETQAG